MTIPEKLRYAQKTGGMIGRMMTKVTGNLFTLDKVFWSGNTYSFLFHINERVGSIYYKQIITLPVMQEIVLDASKGHNAEDLPAVFHMVTKLTTLTKK